MQGCLTVLLIIAVLSILVDYWYIVIPVVILIAILWFRGMKEKREQDLYNARVQSYINQREYETQTQYYNLNIDNMDGHQFEYFCADVLRENGFTEVRVTRGSGDHGIDIIARKEAFLCAIQCKRYSTNVGNKAIQEAYTGKALYNADVAIVMTNQYFTTQAVQEAQQLKVQLWDRNVLLNFLKENNTNYNQSEPKESTFSETKQNKNTQNQYLIGKDLPTGEYLFKVKEYDLGSLVLYLNYQSYLENKRELIRKEIKKGEKYYLSLIQHGTYLVVKNIVIEKQEKNKSKECKNMYDVQKGIYPPGDYLVGEDIEIGKYLLTANSGMTGQVSIYETYQKFKEDEMLGYHSFEDDFHLSLREKGMFIVVEAANIKKL